MTRTPDDKDTTQPLTSTGGTVHEDSAVYHPPQDAEKADQVDASVDGTSASHYGANDPALYEGDQQQD